MATAWPAHLSLTHAFRHCRAYAVAQQSIHLYPILIKLANVLIQKNSDFHTHHHGGCTVESAGVFCTLLPPVSHLELSQVEFTEDDSLTLAFWIAAANADADGQISTGTEAANWRTASTVLVSSAVGFMNCIPFESLTVPFVLDSEDTM